jgi:hypothetical protein
VVDDETDASLAPPTRRRPWLGIACVVALLAIAAGVWWHVEDPFNPYRDGTTHAATLVNSVHMCRNNWGVSPPGYYWQAKSPVPDGWWPGPVAGKVHIIHQHSSYDVKRQRPVFGATFEARGATVELAGGRLPAFNDLTCAITP